MSALPGQEGQAFDAEIDKAVMQSEESLPNQ
jgi:hypothetical protein